MSGLTVHPPAPWPAPPMTAAERNAALNTQHRAFSQALANVIVLAQRRDTLGEPATEAEWNICKARAHDTRKQMDIARTAFLKFEELLNA